MMVLAVDLIQQIPLWAWWICVTVFLIFMAALLRIIAWFLKKYTDDNKESWTEIRTGMTKMTDGISNLTLVTTQHGERIQNHHETLQRHEGEILKLRRT